MSTGQMLTRVAVRNYRSLADVDVTFEPLTVMIGANASGKTSLLMALWLIRAGLTGDLGDATLAQGGRSTLAWEVDGDQPIEIEIDYQLADGRGTYRFVFAFDPGNSPFVVSERLEVAPEMAGTEPAIIALDRVGERVEVREEAERYLELQGDQWRLAAAGLGRFGNYPDLSSLLSYVDGWRFLEPDPRAARQQHAQLATEDLWSDAGNLAPVLHTIALRRPESLATINSYLSALVPGEPEVQPTVVSGIVTLLFRQPAFPHRQMTALEVSDGTIRLLAHLTALETDPAPTLLCLEEPELGLHPEAVAGLTQVLAAYAEGGETQILMSTHSPDALNAIPGPRNVRVVEKGADGSTWIGPIRELEDPESWLDKFTLSELWRMNAIGANP